ncbi:sodium:solute symporter family transporter [Ponticaulis koreensis]|uniref:sodium:solute symporter family transporter n=1 Tax=Ponticaulis koreensis TaxID=1123045 RepID=UPI001EEA4B2B|nr:sodium/solute symporter [Ponticaulis koreensis]
MIIIGWVVSRNMKSGEDLFLAGRSLGFATIGFSLFASNISSTTLIGVTGQAYSSGISVANYELMAGILLAIMAFTTIPVFLKIRITTVPEFFGQRFGPTAQKYISGLTLFLTVFVDMAASIYAGVIVLQVFFPGASFIPLCLGLAVFAGIYTATGGLRAVVYTDVLQAIILLSGAAALSYLIYSEFGFDWETAKAAVPQGHMSLVRPASDAALPWPGLIIGVPVLGWFYWSANQYVIQRVLAAKNSDAARQGASFAGLLKILPLLLLAIPGALAVPLLEPLDNSDLVFPTLISEYLPAGLTGLVLAGLIAAIMSTIDSTLNSASTLVLYDFVNVKERGWSDKTILRIGRFTTCGLIVIAAFWPLVIREFPGVFNYIQQVFGYAVPPVVAVFLVALFWKGTTRSGVLITLLTGHIAGGGIFVWRAAHSTADASDGLPHFTIVAGLTMIASLFLCIAISALDKNKPVNADSVWHPTNMAPETKVTSIFADYRYQAVGVLILTLLVIWLFR